MFQRPPRVGRRHRERLGTRPARPMGNALERLRRGGKVLFGRVATPLEWCRRVVSGRQASEHQTGHHTMTPPSDRWRHTLRAATIDGLLIAAVFLVGVLVALAKMLF